MLHYGFYNFIALKNFDFGVQLENMTVFIIPVNKKYEFRER